MMKPSSLFALFFLFAFITSSAKAKFVLDSDGDMVINGGAYYILPLIFQLGGGFELAKTGNETCPVSVVQTVSHPLYPENGLQWKITSPLRIRFLPLDTVLNFAPVEGKVPNCVPMPSSWTIVEEEDGEKSVKISGVYENAVKGSFEIQKFSEVAYKIVFCPTDGHSCSSLGFSNHGRRLVLNEDYALGLVFRKAESSERGIAQVV